MKPSKFIGSHMPRGKVAIALALVFVVAVAFLARAVTRRSTTKTYVFAKVIGFREAPRGSTAIAVRGGKIAWIGPEAEAPGGRKDHRFAKMVAAPGFVDPSVHVVLSTVALSADAVLAPEDWSKAVGRPSPAVVGKNGFEDGLRRAAAEGRDARTQPMWLGFGHHAATHEGELTKEPLDEAFGDRPAAMLSRCCGVLTCNTAAMKALGLTSGDFGAKNAGADVPRGRFTGVSAANVAHLLFRGDDGRRRLSAGASRLSELLTAAGVCEIADAVGGPTTLDWAREAFGSSPVDIGFSLDPFPLVDAVGKNRAGPAIVRELAKSGGGESVGWAHPPRVHLTIDEPVIRGGHQSKSDDRGNWHRKTLDDCEEMCRAFATRGYDVRYETHGDFGFDIALGQLHRRAFEMGGKKVGSVMLGTFADPDDAAGKAAKAGSKCSFDAGFAGRDATVAPLATFASKGVLSSIHSAMPSGGSGPCDPLRSAEILTTRRDSERGSRASAFRAIAPPSGVGDPANIAILTADPLASGFSKSDVWGVVHRGTVHPAVRRATGAPLPPLDGHGPSFTDGDSGPHGCDLVRLGDSIVSAAHPRSSR